MASNSAFASGRDQKSEIRRRNVGEVTKGDNVPTISISDTKGVAKVCSDVRANLNLQYDTNGFVAEKLVS